MFARVRIFFRIYACIPTYTCAFIYRSGRLISYILSYLFPFEYFYLRIYAGVQPFCADFYMRICAFTVCRCLTRPVVYLSVCLLYSLLVNSFDFLLLPRLYADIVARFRRVLRVDILLSPRFIRPFCAIFAPAPRIVDKMCTNRRKTVAFTRAICYNYFTNIILILYILYI